jgi:chromosome segregation ATPase
LLLNRKLKDDLASVNNRLSTALQSTFQANAEADASKSIASAAVTDSQVNSAAFAQAMHRMQVMDVEMAQIKAENTILKRDIESQASEIRKTKASLNFTGDKQTSTEAETRRIKAQSQVTSFYFFIN